LWRCKGRQTQASQGTGGDRSLQPPKCLSYFSCFLWKVCQLFPKN
jgi:hypothetical protein